MERSILLTLCSHFLVAFYVGYGAFMKALLDFGWGERYHQCCGLSGTI